jgi:hypothetical protein
LPENIPASPQVGTSALPRAIPPVAQEIPPEPEQDLAPIQGIRHEASICTQFCYPFFNEPLLIRQPYSF